MKRSDFISDSRVASMKKGAALYIRRWEDIFNQGIQSLMTDDSPLEMIAEQQVDAGNGHIARQIRLAKSELSADLNPKWLDRICQCLITARALEKIDTFSLIQQIDILVQAGLNQQKKWLGKQTNHTDDFIVLHSKTESLENLFQQTTYLQRIKDGAFAQELKYWHMSETGPKTKWETGQIFSLDYQYYPSALPLRIEIQKVNSQGRGPVNLIGCTGWKEWQNQRLKDLRAHPWLSRRPLLLKNMQIEKTREKHILIDSGSAYQMYFDTPYGAMICDAFSGGNPIDVFAVGEAGQLEVMAVFREGMGQALTQEVFLKNIHSTFRPPENTQ